MMRLKVILQNINLLNILLISAIVIFALYGLFPGLRMNIKYVVPSADKITDAEEKPSDQFQVPSLAEYTKISEENLFHPERRIPPEKKEEVVLPKPEFVLYGTLITDNLSMAYLEDLKAPRNSPGRGKRQVALKKGDSLSGFTLKEIDAEKIVMVRGEERIIVPVNDPAHPKERTETGIASTSRQGATAEADSRRSAAPAARKAAPAVTRPRPAVPQRTTPPPPSATAPQRATSSGQPGTTTLQPAQQQAPQQNIQGAKDMFQKFFRPQR